MFANALIALLFCLPAYSQSVSGEGVDDLPPDAEVPEVEPSPEPTPLTEDEKWEFDIQNKVPTALRREPPAYPGGFLGPRISYGMGSAMIPRYGLGEDRTERETFPMSSPYFGIDAGYTPPLKRWGGGITFDAGIFKNQPDYLATAPVHLTSGIYMNYVPTWRMRVLLGFDALNQLRLVYPSGQILNLRGWGLRTAFHFRSRQPRWENFEVFGFFAWSHYQRVFAGSGGNGQDYPVTDISEPGKIVQSFLFSVGIQYNWKFVRYSSFR